LENLYHLVLIPIYKEPADVMSKTLDALIAQDYPHKKRIIIVFALEERAGEEHHAVMRKLKSRYESEFYAIWDFYHPFGVEGEIIGDACANLRWAGKEASKILQKEGIPSRDVLFTKFDSDTRLHPKHFSALTHSYLTSKRPMNRFFSPAALIYSNNYWKVPGITRVFFGTLTLGILAEWVAETPKKQSFSCYSGNFMQLEKADFWDAGTGAEDTYYYWNLFLHLDGDFEGRAFYLPATMDSVEGTNFISSLSALYKQQLRWGWGVLIMPIALQGMSWNPNISIAKKLSKFGVLFRAYNFLLTAGLLLTLAMPILTLINGPLEYSSISYNLPRIISLLLTGSLISQIPTKYYIWKYYGSPPEERPFWFKAYWWVIEPFLMFVNLWTYYLLPRIQAIYEMTVGKSRKKFLVAIEGRLGTSTS
jgi:cellulose synthase/poly-beta-1,6-N-acetylglucosamine synthase-like glycosyltransferase